MSSVKNSFKPRITVFHCVNSVADPSLLGNGSSDVHAVKMPCSGVSREVFLLRAFEAGADGVLVLVCPEGECRHLEGNLRAAKRVTRMKKLVEEIGLDGRRLNIFNVHKSDPAAVEAIIKKTASDLADLGPNPAA